MSGRRGSSQRWSGALCALAACALALGCSGGRLDLSARTKRCLDHCEESKSCPAASAQSRAVDCFTLCDDGEAVNNAADCYDESDSFYECIDRHGVCETDARCSNQQQVYSDCIAEHCSADPNRDECGFQ